MNIDFAAVGGTAYTVAGSMIIACKETNSFIVLVKILLELTVLFQMAPLG